MIDYPTRVLLTPAGATRRVSAEAKLWAAVVAQAIEDVEKGSRVYATENMHRNCRLFARQARFRLFESALDVPGSLAWICESFDLDIEGIRARARAAIKEGNHYWSNAA